METMIGKPLIISSGDNSEDVFSRTPLKGQEGLDTLRPTHPSAHPPTHPPIHPSRLKHFYEIRNLHLFAFCV